MSKPAKTDVTDYPIKNVTFDRALNFWGYGTDGLQADGKYTFIEHGRFLRVMKEGESTLVDVPWEQVKYVVRHRVL